MKTNIYYNYYYNYCNYIATVPGSSGKTLNVAVHKMATVQCHGAELITVF